MHFFRYSPLVLLGFLAFSSAGANVCSDCAQQYASVRAQAVVITNNLENLDHEIQLAISRNSAISTQIHNIRNYYSVTGTAIPYEVSSACRQAEVYVNDNASILTSLRESVSSSYSAALSQLSTLDSFDCSCSSNSCGCVSVLEEILLTLGRIESGTVDYIHSIMLYVEDLLSTSTSIYQFLYDLRNKILHPDDDYISDLAYISSQIVQSANLPSSLAFDLASNRFSSDTDRSNLELGIGYLYSAEYQHMLISRRSNQTLSDILNVISNISVSVTNSSDSSQKWEADLAFISNYLYSVQRKYYDMFNNIFYYKSGRPHNPYSSIPAYTGITNSWAILRDPSSDRADKLTAFNVLRSSNGTTNWFERIEYALYGIAGFWDSDTSDDASFASSVTNHFSSLIELTNSFSMVSSVFSVSNRAQTVVSEFKNLVDAFHFPSSSMPSATLTLCPSFQIGDFEFSGIAFEMYDISEVLEAIRTAFQFVWTIGFSIFGIGLAAKFFFHLGNAIRDVFILLKTLL